MLVFDPKSKGINPTGGIKKTSKKEKMEKTKFVTGKKTGKSSSGKEASEVADVGQMLFLQEVDEFQQDQESLEEFAKQAFKELKELQLSIMQGKVRKKNLYSLQHVLAGNDHKFITPEIKQLSDEIEIRVAVEIAKLEKAMEENK